MVSHSRRSSLRSAARRAARAFRPAALATLTAPSRPSPLHVNASERSLQQVRHLRAHGIPKRLLRGPRALRGEGFECAREDVLRFVLDALQVIGVAKALGVQLVDRFGSGWSCRKPSVRADNLQPADWRAVAWRVRE